MAKLTGDTLTITNGGIFGSMLSTPVLNPPQSGILSMHNIVKCGAVIDDKIVARPMMYVALSYDHRIIDGREAGHLPGTHQAGYRRPATAISGGLKSQ